MPRSGYIAGFPLRTPTLTVSLSSPEVTAENPTHFNEPSGQKARVLLSEGTGTPEESVTRKVEFCGTSPFLKGIPQELP